MTIFGLSIPEAITVATVSFGVIGSLAVLVLGWIGIRSAMHDRDLRRQRKQEQAGM